MKTVFFDFGNVLAFFDHRRAVERLTRFTDMTADDLFDVLYEGELEDSYERGAITTDEYVRRGIAGGRLTCTPDEFLRCYEDIFRPNPAVLDVVPKLRPRYRVGLASNTNDAHFTHYSRQFADVLAHFGALCPSHRARARKPEADYFAYCQRFAEADPAECVFVDDLTANVAAARSHGWKAILYRPETDLVAELAAVGVVV